MAITPFQKRIKLTTREVVFPKICPHCLRQATATVGIESKRELSGYYVVVTRWKYSSIQVPVCADVAKRCRIVRIVWISSFLLFLAIMALLEFFSSIDKGEVFLLALLVMGPAGITNWVFRLEKYIRLLAVTENSIEFGVLNEQYARELAKTNSAKMFAWHD